MRELICKSLLKVPGNQKLSQWISEERKKMIDFFIEQHPLHLHPSQMPIPEWLAIIQKMPQNDFFEFLQKMPKGAILHGHFDSLVDVDWLIEQIIEMKGFMALDDETIHFVFHSEEKKMPELMKKGLHYKTIDQWKRMPSFRQFLYRHLTLTDLLKEQPDINDGLLWHRFEGTFRSVEGVIKYEPFYEKYLIKKFEGLIQDGVWYLEERLVVSAYKLYNESGYLDLERTFELYESALKKVKQENPLFDAAIIFSGLKFFSESELKKDLELCLKLKQKFPFVIRGYDLVGYEDRGFNLEKYDSVLKEFMPLFDQAGIPFVFHAGETVDFDLLNLQKSLEYNCPRIGHGLALQKSVQLQEIVKSKNICIELCPISNKILKYTPQDLRLHPFLTFLLNDLPVTLSPDDPSIFGIGKFCMTYEWLMLLLCWDLSCLDRQNEIGLNASLIQLVCLNGFDYALLPEENKKAMKQEYLRQWHNLLREYKFE